MKPKNPLVEIWGSHSVGGHMSDIANTLYRKLEDSDLVGVNHQYHQKYDNHDLWDIADLTLDLRLWIANYDT